MADLITASRAQQHPAFKNVNDSYLTGLISAASIAINAKYTISESVTEDVQEACVLFMIYLKEDLGLSAERLGEYASVRHGKIPFAITLLLSAYKKPMAGPIVYKESS